MRIVKATESYEAIIQGAETQDWGRLGSGIFDLPFHHNGRSDHD